MYFSKTRMWKLVGAKMLFVVAIVLIGMLLSIVIVHHIPTFLYVIFLIAAAEYITASILYLFFLKKEGDVVRTIISKCNKNSNELNDIRVDMMDGI